MVSNIWFYISFPAVAALLCLLLLRKAYKSNADAPYIYLFVNLVLMNLLQAMGYVVFIFHANLAEYFADAYLISIYFLFIHLFLIALSLSPNEPKPWRHLVYIFPAILTLLHLAGYIVDGYRLEHNTYMHNDGDLAWCLDLYILFSCCSSAMLFFKNKKEIRNDNVLESRNIIALFSFFPLIIILLGLMMLSRTEEALPMSIIVPFISIYIVSFFYYISRSKIIDLTVGWRAIIERFKLLEDGMGQLNNKEDFDEFAYKWRDQLYREAMARNNNDMKAAAEDINVSESTLRKFFKAQDIKS